MINLVASIVQYKNKLAIGKNGKLLVKLLEDLSFFKNLTKDSLCEKSLLPKNVVLMGSKTYFSIPNRPLKGRYNFVLTTDPMLLSVPTAKDIEEGNTSYPYFMSLATFEFLYSVYKPNVFVIGGSEIYAKFLESDYKLRADKLYITEVKNFNIQAGAADSIKYMKHFDDSYDLSGYSSKFTQEDINYRVLYYSKTEKVSEERKMIELVRNILTFGKERQDRTNTGTLSLFGNNLRIDISRSIPLLTVRKTPFNVILEELLWFLRGDTDAKILQNKGIKIWDGNTSRKFLDSQGLDYDTGVLGPGYGFQWRHFGAKYLEKFADTSNVAVGEIGGCDQISDILLKLKTDPFSRRIILSAWNPSDLRATALVPCHVLAQFYVEEEADEKFLSCQFYMRSSDMLAINFNIVSYALLTNILAAKSNMKPKEILYVSGDAHIYKTHVDNFEKMIERNCHPSPALKLSDSVKDKDFKELTVEDFDLIGYFPQSNLRFEMSI
jgi:dihydrofolate reductase/thymidylate synthase